MKTFFVTFGLLLIGVGMDRAIDAVPGGALIIICGAISVGYGMSYGRYR